ncbi:MAG TPA: sulfatase/phosphatase domain-containing protein, partial [Candidatus Dormibacteraeota bacterium]|nr:sulfatase/phosphatase domain-containing protein [Candidatus Dormibacteraeota bacterium]
RAVVALVSHIDLGPTLLEAASIQTPQSMQGRSSIALLEKGEAAGAEKDALIQISESMTGRALRTPQWAYVVATRDGNSHRAAPEYVEYQLYDLLADPHQLVNLAGRRETREVAARLRLHLLEKMAEAGEEKADILPAALYP